MRAAKGEAALQSAPTITRLEDPLPLHADICRVALPYGLASQFFINEDNMYMAQDFRARFISALEDISQAKEESVVDSYA